MALFGRKRRAPLSEPDPAQDAADEWMSDPHALAVEALADLLLTIPDLSHAAVNRLVEMADAGWYIDPYTQPNGIWNLNIASPERPGEWRRWVASAFDRYVAGEHSTDPAKLCMCEACVARRQAEAMRRGLAVLQGDGGEVA